MINIAEKLRDCPKGTKLYSPICGECELFRSEEYFIEVITPTTESFFFNYNGTYRTLGEVLLFPSKEYRDWANFKRPFKDGDIITCKTNYCEFTAIFKNMRNDISFNYHFMVKLKNSGVNNNSYGDFVNPRLATEEEKQKLFDAIKANGYKWNEETKTLEKLIVPKFKVGDRIKLKNSPNNIIGTVTKVNEDGSISVNDYSWVIKYELQDKYKLVPNKFNISTLKPFDKVLTRYSFNSKWYINLFSHYDNINNPKYPFICINCGKFNQCIPYNDDTKHLLGTTDDCDEYYKNW